MALFFKCMLLWYSFVFKTARRLWAMLGTLGVAMPATAAPPQAASMEGSSGHASPQVQHLSLLELPAPWQVQLVLHMDYISRLAALRTCKQLKDLVLRYTKHTTLTLPPEEGQHAQAISALQLAHKRGDILTLDMSENYADAMFLVEDEGFEAATACGSITCAVLTAASDMGLLSRVTQLHLSGLELEAPLLPLFSDGLPSLIRFHLSYAWLDYNRATADSFTGRFPHLKSLCMTGIEECGPFPAWRPYLRKQIEQLTAVKHLSLVHDTVNGDDDFLAAILEAATPHTAERLS